MKIELTLTTKPKTITRIYASNVLGCHPTFIDKLKDENKIDYGMIGRYVYIVDNQKWKDVVKKHGKTNKK
jgi:hypothetical protein